MGEEAEREQLERELGGAWEPVLCEAEGPVASALPAGGPARLWRAPGAIAFLGYSAGRLAKERAGHALLANHPACPTVLTRTEHAIVLAPFGDRVPDPSACLADWPGELQHVTGTRRELLRSFGASDEPDPIRALHRIGLRRRDVDRWLAAELSIRTEVGPSFGGVHPGWLREQEGRAVCLRCDRARPSAWKGLDRAGFLLDDAGPSFEPDLELPLVFVWLRELSLSGDEARAATLRALISPPAHPDEVRVWIDGPSFLDAKTHWHAPGELVSASRARFLLAELDGLDVGGARISVRTDPPIRKGRRGMRRENRNERQRRIFSRFDHGIRTDEEGLFSATPEALALSVAEHARGVVLDGTTGIGSLAIAFARQPNVTRVIAVERDEERLLMARHNASIYDVLDRIEFVHGDIEELVDRVSADLLVLDPPWGGRDYDRTRVALDDFSLDVRAVLERFRGKEILLKLPRSFDPSTLPADFTIRPAVDERGILKFLWAQKPFSASTTANRSPMS